MFERVQKIFDRVESRIALWKIFAGSGVMGAGGISAWVASATKWLDAYAPASWWFAFLLGALIALLLVLSAVWLKYAWIKGGAFREWRIRADTVNPLDSEFQRKRLKVLDLTHPVTKSIKNKRFIDCELVGPANILILGNSKLGGIRFTQCDLVVINNKRSIPIQNVITFDNVQFVGGEILSCAIYIAPESLPSFQALGATAITLTGNPEIDSPPPEGTEQETPP